MDEWDETRTSSMANGFPEEGVVTCTLCPTGCQVRSNEALGEYEGNKCKRGAAFAEQERVDPQRILTTTVKVADRKTGDGEHGRIKLLPVRSAEPVSKRNLPQLVHELSRITVEPPVKCGDVVAEIQDGEKTVAIAATADCSL